MSQQLYMAAWHGAFRPSGERRSAKRRFRLFRMAITGALNYWLWGGIRDAIRLGKTFDSRSPFYWQCVCLCGYGIWVALPFDCFSPGITLASVLIPEPVIGLSLIVVGRYGLHSILGGRRSDRCNASVASMICFLALLFLGWSAQPASLGNAVWFLASWCAIWINRRLCRRCHCPEPSHDEHIPQW